MCLFFLYDNCYFSFIQTACPLIDRIEQQPHLLQGMILPLLMVLLIPSYFIMMRKGARYYYIFITPNFYKQINN